MMTLQIYIGFDPHEVTAYHVLCHSLLSRASGPISLTPLVQSALRTQRLYTRERDPLESTEFSLTRFLVPHLSRYKGMSIFMDCDMLARGDIYELMKEVDFSKAVSVVQHDYIPSTARKMQNQVQSVYPRKNWSSLMVFNNIRCQRLTCGVVNCSPPSDLHQFKWVRDRDMGALPKEWNYLVGEENQTKDEPKLVHFTQGGPWWRQYQFCEFADEWFEELDCAFPSLNLARPEEVSHSNL